MPRERDFYEKIMNVVRKKYPRAYVRKIADRFSRGIPDIVITFPCKGEGRTLYVEVKMVGEKCSRLQEEEHEQIRRACGTVVIAYGVDDVMEMLDVMGAEA
mgnify:CR=1 FL=1